jgi:hypothetical protein
MILPIINVTKRNGAASIAAIINAFCANVINIPSSMAALLKNS